ncbi:MAG TPA: MOSC N-terminal beta barrel domain-containing protein [Moraxellaceae bacterium]|nr:MOSC N-terminal beta barrel domain-containing protein [Moraxellaceae bacterium]
MHISELAIHPLKSARRVLVPELRLGALGPESDRRWMLVDAQGCFVTQRTHPRLCLLSALPEPSGLRLSAEGMSDLVVPVPAHADFLRVTVWDDAVMASPASAEADRWCSAFLGLSVRLVYMPAEVLRAVDPRYAGQGHRTAFSDGFPLLLVTQSSLDHLNRLLKEEGVPTVDWGRFRPNIVVEGDIPPHAEDGWQRLRIGETELMLVKPCSRCVIPSIDPVTAVKDGRILTILRRYRGREDGRIYLGQNVVVAAAPAGSRLKLGDKVQVLR